MKYLKGTLLTINIICLIGLLGCYAAYYLNPFEYWYVSILGLAYFVWVGANVAFVIIWLFIKWKYGMISLAAIILGYSYHSKMMAFNVGKSGKDPIKVMSYNIQLFKFYDWKKNEIQRDKILYFIDDNKADIYCFQEYFQTDDHEFSTTKKLKNIIPDHFMHFEAGVIKNKTQQYGVATFSKYPIVNKGMITIDSTKDRTNLVIYTDVLIKSDTVRVYNVHLASNHLNTNEVDSIVGTNKNSLSFVKKWLKKLKNGYKRRFDQVNLVTKHFENCRYPCIITGDFNDVPVSYTYRKINRKFKDSFIESGSGIGATYNGNLPMLRIDYIFHSSHFSSGKFKVHPMSTTDHYPISAELYMKKK